MKNINDNFEEWEFDFDPINKKFLIKAICIGAIITLALLGAIVFLCTLIF